MSSEDSVIKVENISKDFKLPHEKHNSLKAAVINFYKGQHSYEIQQALKNVTFEVRPGEFFGIVGRNGSGKSTLLKLLAGIYYPTKGSINITGRLMPFIELGVGFNQELTGRENLFLNGALLGISRKEMKTIYNDIVQFAELERFMDQKLKNYSSGMQVRLAFSIAVRADTDILLIDEVLAVGDANFQAKCINVFKEMKSLGKTIVFVSHDMGMVRRFCDRVIMIQQGKMIAEGNAEDIAELYEEANITDDAELKTFKMINRDIKKRDSKIITHLRLKNGKGVESSVFDNNEQVTLEITLKDLNLAKNLGVAIYSRGGAYVFGTNTINDKFNIGKITKYTFNAKLGEGEYRIKIGVFGDKDTQIYEFYENGPALFIRADKKNKVDWEGILELPHSWD
jgi:ABC-2 type transport system ATP-binding protein